METIQKIAFKNMTAESKCLLLLSKTMELMEFAQMLTDREIKMMDKFADEIKNIRDIRQKQEG